MRMIVESFKESLELGLAKHNQIVVSTQPTPQELSVTHNLFFGLAYDPYLRLWMARGHGEG